jgi:hypothetical protein
MTNITDADREAEIQTRDVSAAARCDEDFTLHFRARLFAAHRELGVREAIAGAVAWGRAELIAEYGEAVAREKEAWWFFDAIERGEHLAETQTRPDTARTT